MMQPGATETSPVAIERDGAVATLWLDRAERGNALGVEIVDALDAAVDAVHAEGARLIILRGRGRNFCTGLDLGDLESLSDGDLALRIIRIELLLQKIHALPVTTMAIAGGRVFGAGADLFAVCDHRVALQGASFAFPGPAFGLVLGTARLGGLVGDRVARRVLLAGEAVDADAALSIGLASAVLAEDAVSGAIHATRAAATRLDAETVAGLHRRTRRAADDADLAALVRSATRPGLVQRVKDYRTAMAARR